MTWARALALGGALLLVACAPRQNKAQTTAPRAPLPTPPSPQSMDQALVLGLWDSNFEAVKIERDPTAGEDGVMGVWVYDRNGQEVIGYFSGNLRGNLLEFAWHEPATPTDLTGRGFISFGSDGLSFTGRWWSQNQERSGVFRGWRDRVYAPSAAAENGPGSGEPMPGQ